MSEDHAHAHPNYVKIWGYLVVLFLISFAGPFLEIRWLTLVTAFGIAVWKAYLVAKNFMHINIEKRYVLYMVTTCLVFMFLFFAGVAPDVMKHEGSGWMKPKPPLPVTSAAAMAEVAAHGGAAGHGETEAH